MKSKIVGVFEVTSTAVKFVSGYLLDNEVIILSTAKVGLENGVIVDGEINDYNSVSNAISQALKDGTSKLSSPIAEYGMIIPPIGFEVYDHSQETSVVSSEDTIEKIDVDNVLNQVSKAKTTEGSKIIGILPELYILDKGQSFPEPPLGQHSNSLMVKAKLHVCPSYYVASFKKVFKKANINFADKNIYVAPHAALEVIKEYQNIPNDFLLVDLGARLTSVSLIGQQKLIASTFVYHGGDHITDKLASYFGIDFSVAQQLKEIFGFDEHNVSFKASLFSVTSQEKKKVYTIDDFKEAIGNNVNEYVKEISNTVKEIATMYDPSIVNLPLILVGGGTKFYGLADTIKGYLNSNDIRVYIPRAIGARDAQFTNCVGALKIIGNENPIENEEVKITPEVETSKTRKIKMRKDVFNEEI